MMSKHKKIAATIAVITVVVIGAIGSYSHYIIAFGAAREVVQAKRRLLCETDHQALLDACRELTRQVRSGQLEAGVYGAPEMLRFPEPIPTLRPKFVTLDRDGVVMIEMGFGMWPLGVQTYPEDYPKYPPPFRYGDRELVKGLWYYEDGYSLHPKEYDRRIDQLLGRNKKLKRAVPESNARSS